MPRPLTADRRRYATKLARRFYDERPIDLQAFTLAELAAGSDTTVALLAVADLRRLVDELEAGAVARARADRVAWRAIGEALGAGKSTIHDRHRRRGVSDTRETAETGTDQVWGG